jgi:hypothetical protein
MNPIRGTAAIALIAGAVFAMQCNAQSSGGAFRVEPFVIAGGGSPIAGGSFQITSTLGQPATSTLSGGSYVVFDGFWAPVGGTLADLIFANGFESP